MPKCPLALIGDKEMVEWESWARNQLMAAGSDLLGKFSNLQVSANLFYPNRRILWGPKNPHFL